MRIAVDTNILLYAEGLNGRDRQLQAAAALAVEARQGRVVVSAQVLKEFYVVLRRKSERAPSQVRLALEQIVSAYMMHAVTSDIILAAADLAERHRLSWWDAIVLAAAADAGSEVLLSEDLQPGFVWRGCQVVNPFA